MNILHFYLHGFIVLVPSSVFSSVRFPEFVVSYLVEISHLDPSFPVLCLAVSLCTCSHLQKKASLMTAEQGTHHSNTIQNYFTSIFCVWPLFYSLFRAVIPDFTSITH